MFSYNIFEIRKFIIIILLLKIYILMRISSPNIERRFEGIKRFNPSYCFHLVVILLDRWQHFDGTFEKLDHYQLAI